MQCKKCKKEIPDDSVWCCYCGKKLIRAKPKRSKRPNGSGSVFKLSGNRKRPWVVVVGKDRKCGGTYETEAEANIVAARLVAEKMPDHYNDTIQMIYDAWSKIHFTGLSEWGKQGYETAWNYFSDIKSVKMRDVKADVLQSVVDKAIAKGKSRGTCEKIRNLSGQLCKYAMQQDIINKNYAQFLILPKQEKKEKEIFTDDEIATLFANDDDRDVQIILVLIYTGFRIDELFSLETDNVHIQEGYMIGGEKTEAGKNRVVPINEKIMPYIKAWYAEASEKGYKYLVTNTEGNKMNPNNFRKRGFYRVLGDLGIQPHIDKDHPASKYARLTPHSTRHTFASLAARAGVKPEVLQKLIGHSHYETTADIYIHENLPELKDGIAKL